jgi:hypothetical protein
VAVDFDGNSEVVARVRTTPDGSLVTHADLTGLADRAFNEIVVDRRGNASSHSRTAWR